VQVCLQIYSTLLLGIPMVTGAIRIKTTAGKESRVEELRQKLGYPIKQLDPQGSDFYYLRPGNDVAEAADTCPIAIGFFSELNGLTDEREIQQLLTSKEWQQRIYGHYLKRDLEHKPVMYLLLPTEGFGRVPLVLPTEGGLRQRNIQSFAWGSAELETRLNRLRQGDLPIALKALVSIPLVERAFYEPIKTAKELAQLLARAARQIENVIPKVYKDEERRYPASGGEDGYLHKLLKSFQQELLPSLRLASENEKDYSFSDIYAQTIAYSLFTARVFSYVRDQREGREKEELFDRSSAWQQLPETNPFLRRLFQDISERSPEELGDELIGAIAEIFAILRAAKMDVILQDFRQKQNREDIVIRFYEDFLAAYKPEMRERRGVYYTPEPVVSYMVRSVDVLLKEKFNKPLGLADPEVMILDPACGTGTFLLWICQLIHERFHTEREAIVARVGDISWSEYVGEHLLPRIFGFELLMAPYAIAHLKLGLFLDETGYQFDSGKRLEVYLTNTLDDPKQQSEFLFGGFVASIIQRFEECGAVLNKLLMRFM
jgi:N-6 DNA Methylase